MHRPPLPETRRRSRPTFPVADTRSAGFTLVELVVVIVIVGVLSTFAVPRFFGENVFAERGYYEELTGALRLAQKTAVATGCPVRFVVASNSYAAAQQSAAGGRCNVGSGIWDVPVVLGTGEPLSASAPDGVTAAPATSIVFLPAGDTNLGGDQAFTVGAHSFVVHAGSGYVDVP